MSNQQNEFEPKACIEVVFSYKIELPLLSREPTQFVYVYPELVIQHDVSTQADIFPACSSPKKPYIATSCGKKCVLKSFGECYTSTVTLKNLES